MIATPHVVLDPIETTTTAQSATRRLRIAWCLPRYLPVAPCGAEWTAHELLTALARRGHEAVAIITGREAGAYRDVDSFEGVKICELTSIVYAHDHFDVVLGHLGNAAACRLVAGSDTPVVWMAHAAYQYEWSRDAEPDHYIANSQHVLAAGPPGTWIMRPHVPSSRYAGFGGTHTAITLIGATDQKGLPVLRRLATAMPHAEFRVVQSAYDRQRIGVGQRGNIDIWQPQPNILDAYRAASVLLVPSVESWGRVAVEAAWNGVPVVATPSAGLTEAMGDAAIYVDGRDIPRWRKALRELDDPALYHEMSAAGRLRAQLLEQRSQIDQDHIIRQLEEIT